MGDKDGLRFALYRYLHESWGAGLALLAGVIVTAVLFTLACFNQNSPRWLWGIGLGLLVFSPFFAWRRLEKRLSEANAKANAEKSRADNNEASAAQVVALRAKNKRLREEVSQLSAKRSAEQEAALIRGLLQGALDQVLEIHREPMSTGKGSFGAWQVKFECLLEGIAIDVIRSRLRSAFEALCAARTDTLMESARGCALTISFITPSCVSVGRLALSPDWKTWMPLLPQIAEIPAVVQAMRDSVPSEPPKG